MTRNGKIARLPGLIRDELNQRLENGQEGPALLKWLNAQPFVKAALKEHFDGAPVTKQNLSEWRLGGFRAWQIRQDLLAQARQIQEADSEMDDHVNIAFLPGALAGALAARYAALLNQWDGEPDPKFEEKLRLLRGLNRDLALLQKTLQQVSRQKRDAEQALDERIKREEEEEKKELVAPIMAKIESEDIAAVLQGGERGRRYAEFMAAVKHHVPPPRDWMAKSESLNARTAQARQARQAQAQSNPVQPSPTPSNPTEKEPVPASPTQSNSVQPDLTAEKTLDSGLQEPNDVVLPSPEPAQ